MARKALTEEEKRVLEEQLELRNKIVTAAGDLVYKIGEQIGLDEDQQQTLEGQLNTIDQITSGNYLGAATSFLSTLMEMIPKEADKFAGQIEDINKLLEEHQRLIAISERKGGGEEARRNELNDLEKKLATQQAALKKAEDELTHGWSWWRTEKGMKEAAAAAERLTDEILDTNIAIEDAQQSLDDFLSGDITENTIASAIAQGFQEGKTSVDDFAGYMNDILLDAVMNVFKSQYLLPLIDQYFMPALGTFLADGTLDPDEIADLNERIGYIGDMAQPYFDALTGGLDLGGDSINQGLTGQIQRSITEETGTELAGLFRRFADDQRVAKDYSILGVTHLVGIEANTAQTVTELQNAVIELQAININTKGVNVVDL